MSDPEQEVVVETILPTPDAPAGEEKKKRGRKKAVGGSSKPRAPRAAKTAEPSFKDWLRVKNSTGNSCPNTSVKVVIDMVNKVCHIDTNAPASEGSNELEGVRRQTFRITDYELV